jgi:uncharacterized protein (TIGR02284 family)
METEDLIDNLNDLIAINNDRIEGYEKALVELDEESAVNLSRPSFGDRIQESQVFVNELADAVVLLGGKPQEGTTASGKIYRAWMDLKTAFTGGSTKSVLELCEYGEDVAVKAYDKALEDSEANWPPEILNMLTRQRQVVKEAHDLIRDYRDNVRRVNA